MNAERGYLVNNIFPRLKKEYDKLGLTIIPVDLRWGITEEEQRQGRVIATCLEQVDAARPFFIGILGNRYGSVFTEADLGSMRETLTRQYPWLKQAIAEGRSVTEIEILYSSMMNESSESAFYLRSPKMQVPPSFCELPGSEGQQKLEALRAKIKTQNKHRVGEYTSLEQLGEMVYDDIKSFIAKEYPELKNKDSLDYKYYRSLTTLQHHIEWKDIHSSDAFFTWWESKCRSLLVTGLKGVGKSHSVAHWVEETARFTKSVYGRISITKVNYAYVDVATLLSEETTATGEMDLALCEEVINGVEYRLCQLGYKNEGDNLGAMGLDFLSEIGLSSRRMMMASVKNIFQHGATNDFIEGITGLPASLRASKRRDAQEQEKIMSKNSIRIVLVIDNLDLLTLESRNRFYDFLDIYNDSLRPVFVADSDSPMAAGELTTRFHPEVISLAMPEEDKLRDFINYYLGRHRKHLDPQQIDLLCQGFYMQDMNLLTKLLDHLIAFGSYERLTDEIRTFASIKQCELSRHLFAEKLISSALNDLSEVKADSLLGSALMALSNTSIGLNEDEIIAILGLSPLQWNMIRGRLGSFCEVEDGRFVFVDDYMLSSTRSVIIASRIHLDIQIVERMMHLFANGVAACAATLTYGGVSWFVHNYRKMLYYSAQLPAVLITLGHGADAFALLSSAAYSRTIRPRILRQYWDKLWSEGYHIADAVNPCHYPYEVVQRYTSQEYKVKRSDINSVLTCTKQKQSEYYAVVEEMARKLGRSDEAKAARKYI